jgi:HK97 family phage prohead protease
VLYKNVSNSSISGVIKDVDTKTGTVTGYFSIFSNVDSDGDMIMPGAFKRTLNNNYRRIKHLNQHRSYEPLSGTKDNKLVVREDTTGLYFESQISQTSYGKDVILLYQDGVLEEHSIGYEVIKSRDSDNMTVERYGRKVPVKELHELKLWEGSTVTFGANELARVESVKALSKEQAIEKMNGVLKALRNGNFQQEEIYEMLDLHFEQLKQHISDLSTSPEGETSQNPQASVKDTDKRKQKRRLAFIEIQNLLTA